MEKSGWTILHSARSRNRTVCVRVYNRSCWLWLYEHVRFSFWCTKLHYRKIRTIVALWKLPELLFIASVDFLVYLLQNCEFGQQGVTEQRARFPPFLALRLPTSRSSTFKRVCYALTLHTFYVLLITGILVMLDFCVVWMHWWHWLRDRDVEQVLARIF